MRYSRLVIFLPVIAAAVLLLEGAKAPDVSFVRERVDILRDRWGVPHIYAKNIDDLFFAQGWTAAHDRLFQIDLWRRANNGTLAEILGPSAIGRDRIARLVRFRGNWEQEWRSYSPDAKQIAVAFTNGINHYIHSLQGARPLEFKLAGYDPGLWVPEDITGRVAGLVMSRNLTSEIQRAMDISKFGIETVQKYMPPDPFRALEPAAGLDLTSLTQQIISDYVAATGPVWFPGEQGSNSWVVDGTKSVTGKPLLAGDPHRPLTIPSLQKTVHLSAPGWDVIGAGDPALPGIILGHNDDIAFGFTNLGIDQQDLYVEKLNPDDPRQYLYKGQWKPMEIERQQLTVKGESEPRTIELHYTQHGPVIYDDVKNLRAYALRWAGAEPGGAPFLGALSLSRARNWDEFSAAAANCKIPSEDLVYADGIGNIGWIAAGLAPVRKNWAGLLPVPGDTGDYEWDGFIPAAELPREYNPAQHFIAAANQNILPAGYPHVLSYEWAPPDRFERIEELLSEKSKLSVDDFKRIQQDVTSLEARHFLSLVHASELQGWTGDLRVDSHPALLYEMAVEELPKLVFGPELGSRVSLRRTLDQLQLKPNPQAIEYTLAAARVKSRDMNTWGDAHKVMFEHPLKIAKFNRGPIARPGDGTTVNTTSPSGSASYRQILDLSNWDHSLTTNAPGESGDPTDRHYSDLLQDWAWGQYHPLPFSRKAVEGVTDERLFMQPKH